MLPDSEFVNAEFTLRVNRAHSPFELGMGLVDMPFEIANIQCENPEAAAHTRIGWFRSVSNIPHAFAVQSFVAELSPSRATKRLPGRVPPPFEGRR